MFSGIVEEAAEVAALVPAGDGARLAVRSSLDHESTALGDSIAIDGVCLTVVTRRGGLLEFDLAAETVRRSALGEKKPGDRVNLERSLKLGDRLHGHFVFGHVDTVISLASRAPEGNSEKFV